MFVLTCPTNFRSLRQVPTEGRPELLEVRESAAGQILYALHGLLSPERLRKTPKARSLYPETSTCP